jgi:hypothetical protein
LAVVVLLLLLLVELVDAAESRANGSLRHSLVGTVVALSGAVVVVVVSRDIMLALRVWSRRGRLSGRRGLGRSAKAGKQMGAAGTRRRNRVLSDGCNLGSCAPLPREPKLDVGPPNPCWDWKLLL